MKRRDVLKMTALGAIAGPRLAFGQAQGQAPRSPASDRIGIGMIGVAASACPPTSPAAPRTPVSGGPPPGVDWDLWLGPAPKLPYDEVWNVGRRGYWDFWGGKGL